MQPRSVASSPAVHGLALVAQESAGLVFLAAPALAVARLVAIFRVVMVWVVQRVGWASWHRSVDMGYCLPQTLTRFCDRAQELCPNGTSLCSVEPARSIKCQRMSPNVLGIRVKRLLGHGKYAVARHTYLKNSCFTSNMSFASSGTDLACTQA